MKLEWPQTDDGHAAAYQPLVIVLAAVCGGIVADRVLGLSFFWSWPLALVAWLGWLVAWRRQRHAVATVLLLGTVALAGAAWHHCVWSLYPRDELGLLAEQSAAPAAIELRAASGARRVPAPPPDPMRMMATPERTRLEVEVLAIRDDGAWRPTSGRATLMIDGQLLNIRAGDRLRVFAQLQASGHPNNLGEFDFAALARASRRLCFLRAEFPESVTRLAEGSKWSATRIVSWLRARGDALLWRHLDATRAGLASAMFLGSREELEPDESQAFLETGTIHLLVISGLNVGILASSLFLVLRVALVPRAWALAIVALASLMYAAVTDAQPPVVRATVMVLIACLASVLGRRALGFNSIAAAGLIVLAINPAELFQAGTQLSFLSVLVLAWLAERRANQPPRDPLQRLIDGSRPWHERTALRLGGWVGRSVLASVVIWLVICPLVMARFHLVSPVAVVLGPLLALPVAIAMATGFGILAVGWLVAAPAALFGWLCDRSLAVMEWCVQLVRVVRGNHFWVPGPHDWWLVGLYAALGVYMLAPRWVPSRRWCLGLLAGWTALGLAVPLVGRRAPERLECTFLAVGHGAAVVVELPGGRTLLYDAGRLGSPAVASRIVSGFLWSRGITHLDAVVISHADADHYNALPALLEQFSVGAVYVSPLMFDHPNQGVAALRAAIEHSGVPLSEVWSGDQLRTASDARIEVLHPPRAGVLGSDNANSIVLAIDFEGRRILLTGDLESPGLDDMLAEEPLDCDVVLAPHHGSAFSDPPGFVDWSTPEWAVVSGGSRDRLDVVANAYRARGCRVEHTADRGAVRVKIENANVSVDCWHSAPE